MSSVIVAEKKRLLGIHQKALLIALGYGLRDWRDIAADARLHRSPNAGWPEAAMSRALGIALSGPRSYDGKLRDFPWVNAKGRRDLGPEDISRATTALWRTWTALLFLVVIAYVLH